MSKDWLNQYGSAPRMFQQGGPMNAAPAPGGAPQGGEPAPQGAPQGGEPNIEAMLAEYAQTRDPQLAVAICDMLVEAMGAGQAQPGGQPAPAEGGAPQMGRNGLKMSAKKGPVFKKKAGNSKC